MLNNLRPGHNVGSDPLLRYRADIDGLRAIAVLSVVLFHAGVSGLSGGFAGVDIFFVISGYLITSLILKDIGRGRFSFYMFYLRRAKRIFPALAVVMAATLTTAWFILLPQEFKKLGTSMLATSFFFSNFHFAENIGYFSGPAIDKPLLHTWSLAIEEQFYILFPAALAFFLPRLGRARMTVALLAVAALSLVAAELLVRGGSEKAFFMPHVRTWELLAGALIAFQQDRVRLNTRVATLMSVAGLAALFLSITMLGPTTPFPGLNAVLPCLGAALLLLAGGVQRTPVQALLALPPLRAIGLISYSLYLWHWPLSSLTHYYLNRPLDITETAMVIAASFVSAALSWRFVEQPVRTSALGLSDPQRGLRITAAPLLALAAAGLVLIVTRGLPWRLREDVAQAYRQSFVKPPFSSECTTTDIGTARRRCRFGAPRKGESYDMVVWGDSNARHFVPVLESIAEKTGLSGWQITPSGCAPILGAVVLNADHRPRNDCIHKDDAIRAFVRANKKLKLIVLAAHWSHYTGSDEPAAGGEYRPLVENTNETVSVANSRRVMAVKLQETVDYFTSLGLEVIVLGQIARFPYPPLRCNLRRMLFPETSPECSVPYEKERSFLEFPHGVIAHLNASPKLTRIFPHEFLCRDGICKSRLKNTILYRDATHLNPTGALMFDTFLSVRLQPLLARLNTGMDAAGGPARRGPAKSRPQPRKEASLPSPAAP